MKKLLCTVSAITLLLVGCGKDGGIGPEGRQGEPGTANVVSSEWFSAKDWDRNIGNYEKTAFYTISQDILNEIKETSLKSFLDNGGTFLVYLKREGMYYHMLPVTFGTLVTCNWGLDSPANPNRFVFTVLNRNGGAIPDALGDHTKLSLRYVMIPAGRVLNGVASVNGQRIGIDQLKTMSYEQAGAAFGWEE